MAKLFAQPFMVLQTFLKSMIVIILSQRGVNQGCNSAVVIIARIKWNKTSSFFEVLMSSDVLILILKVKLNLLHKSYLVTHLNKVE